MDSKVVNAKQGSLSVSQYHKMSGGSN